jgi:hypothetical protein
VRYPEEVGAEVLIEGIQGMQMRAGEDEQVAWRHRIEVHDRDDVLIFVCCASLCPPGGDLTQQARIVQF